MKKRILNDVKVVVEIPSNFYWYSELEQRAKALERWAKDFEEFIRDHRSQDPVSLVIEREFSDICEHCGLDWEEDEDGPLCCNKAQEEHNAAELRVW